MSTSSLIESVSDRFPDAVAASHTYRGDETVVLRRESLLEVARFLKEDPALQMNFLMDLTAVDYSTFGKSPAPAFFASSGVGVSPLTQIQDEDPWPGPPGETRFAVVYHFYSLKHKHRLRLVVPVEEAEPGQPCRSWPLIHAIWAGEPHCRQCSFSAASCCTSCLGAVSRFAITGSGATPVAPNSSRPELCLTGHPPRAPTSQILPSRLIRPRLSHFKTTVPIAGSVASSSSKHSLPN